MNTTGYNFAPMSETKNLFLYEMKGKIATKYQYDPALSGKWVLFYQKQSMDRVWKEVCKLYHEEQLEGIEFLKTSTAKFHNRLKDSDLGMMSFICGPCDDLALITSYGMALLKMLHLHNLGPFDIDGMPYTSRGVISPGSRVTHTTNTVLLEIGIPMQWISQHCLASLSIPPSGVRDWIRTCNCEVNPTKETQAHYLYEYDENTAMKYQYEHTKSGKWMLIYPTQILDFMWASACQLYRNEELEGVKYMKVSTATYNPRHHFPDMGVIMFYCGPSSKRKLMKQSANRILEKMQAYGPFHQTNIEYEVDHRSELYLRTPNKKLDSMIRLPIPKELRYGTSPQNVRQPDNLPSKIFDKKWLSERDESISSKWVCGPSVGYWLMVFEETLLDEAWKKVRDLYRSGQLTGIQNLSVSTAKLIGIREGEPKLGFISCFCGPSEDVDLVKTFGENLAKLTNYFDTHDYMAYKFNKETICRVGQQRVYQPRNSACSLTTDKNPSELIDNEWLIERNASISSKWVCDQSKRGRWVMMFYGAWLDRAWRKVRDLYRAQRLVGIQSLSVCKEQLYNDGDDQPEKGFISCFCGPSDDVDLVKTYGENLAKLMDYSNREGKMDYRANNEKLFSIRLRTFWKPEIITDKKSKSRSRLSENDVDYWRK